MGTWQTGEAEETLCRNLIPPASPCLDSITTLVANQQAQAPMIYLKLLASQKRDLNFVNYSHVAFKKNAIRLELQQIQIIQLLSKGTSDKY